MYIVVDTVSRNVLGEAETLAAAKTLFLRLVASHPAAYKDLKVLGDRGREEVVSTDEIRDALDAVVA